MKGYKCVRRFWKWIQIHPLISQSNWNQIWYEASGQKDLHRLCSPLRSTLLYGAVRRSASNFVIFYKSCQKLPGQMRWIWYGVFWSMSRCFVVLDNRGGLGPGKWAERSSFILAMNTETFSPNLLDQCGPSVLLEHEVDDFYWYFARHLDPALLRASGQFIPKSDIFFKNLIVRNLQAMNAEIDIGNPVPCLAINLGFPNARAPRKGRGGFTVHHFHWIFFPVTSRQNSRPENNALMLTCAPYVPNSPVKVRSRVRPLIRLFTKSSSKSWLWVLRNVSCKMFKCLTHFDAFLRFGRNTHCLPIRVGRYRNLVGVKRAMVRGTL